MNAPAKPTRQSSRTITVKGVRRPPQAVELFESLTLKHIDRPEDDTPIGMGEYPFIVTRSSSRILWVVLDGPNFGRLGRPLAWWVNARNKGQVAFYLGLEIENVNELEQLVE